MAEAVVVGVRVRPFNDLEKSKNATLCVAMNNATTTVTDAHGKETSFTFDESFWSHDGYEEDPRGYLHPKPGSRYADQKVVFDRFGGRVLDNAWAGFHCCLFAYGQTGSGKSYSMVGYGPNEGIVPISCGEIFARIAKDDNKENHFEVTVSMVEIYNDVVQDLLIPVTARPKKGFEIRESKILGIYIDNITRRPVENYDAIHSTIEEAQNHRTVGSTLMNETSSRAHTVLLIEFKSVIEGYTRMSMINLVDLAGSEKAKQTKAEDKRFKEGEMINKSLSALGNVIEKLAEKSMNPKKNIIVPYRDSKLTRLLQNALGGSSKTIMVCALSPASSNYEETLSTLRYADRAKKIKNIAVVNENPQERLMRELMEENDKLRHMMSAATAGQGIDCQLMEDMSHRQKMISEAENALAEMQKTFEQRLQEAKMKQAQQSPRRRTAVTVALTTAPMIVNLNDDHQLTGRVRYSFPEGVTTIGGHSQFGQSDDSGSSDEDSDSDESSSTQSQATDKLKLGNEEPDISLISENIKKRHATVVNSGGRCVITATGEAAAYTCLNGMPFDQMLLSKGNSCTHERVNDGFIMNHGDRVIFGRCYFVFVDPSIAPAEVLIASGHVDYNTAKMEEQSHKRASTATRLRQSLFSADQIFAGVEGLEAGDFSAQALLEEQSKQLKAKDDALKAKDEDLKAKEAELRAKDQEITALRRQLLQRVPGVGAEGYGALEKDEVMHGNHKAISESIDTTFQDAISQLSAMESMLLSGLPSSMKKSTALRKTGDVRFNGIADSEVSDA
eukprot:gb/GFBE01027640.1/.p1 GENE.gb/GFBE01027640.1/~~gb/GFBE01027640.1/.p1  ORF type:complete len:786 (+),score=184.12 gb/GFBE01027640.1/:1-2358(+)